MEKSQAVVVTTEHRGVFFGYLDGELTKEKVKLAKARNCVYWDAGTRGFMGLADSGPTAQCRVGPAIPSLELFDITAVLECTEHAVKAWEEGPWRG
jgi:hypothetical protein